MSVKVMSQVWEYGPKSQGELLVLLALADFADDAGVCWPAMKSIAEKARVTERGAQKIARRLEENGYLKIATGGGRHGCNKYTITLNSVHPEQGSAPNVDTQKPRTRVQETPNGGSPEPSRTINEPSKKSAREILLSILSEETADDFIEHRKAIKAPVTPQAAKALVKKCAGFRDADSIFNESIANGWRGVFPERGSQQPSKPLFDLSNV